MLNPSKYTQNANLEALDLPVKAAKSSAVSKTAGSKSASKVIFAAIAASTMLLSGCVTDGNTYNRSSVGVPSEILAGRLVGVEPINVQGSNSGIGAISGAALGGALGSNVGRNRRYGRGNAAAGVGFAILGGLVGAAIEQGATSSNGYRYTVELEDGRIITVVQKDRNPVTDVGSNVRVEYGRFVRILPA